MPNANDDAMVAEKRNDDASDRPLFPRTSGHRVLLGHAAVATLVADVVVVVWAKKRKNKMRED